ncbi:MAG: hypothetical protein JWO78_112 [Micavibrio sp.]|nr:hypothetical protein [Micavibrio sp.]
MKTNRNTQSQERRVSLQETMNQMARRMEGLLDEAEHKKEQTQGTAAEESLPGDDLRLWAAVDPVLADLQKHLADARANMLSLQKQRGAKDPMAEIAQDMTDSAASAVETRLIELRHSAEKKAALKIMIIREQDEKFFAEQEAERLYSKNFWAEFARPKGKRVENKQANDSVMMVMASLLVLRLNLQRATHALSIAASFGRASGNDRVRLAT